MKKHKIYIVGIGPGSEEMMTLEAIQILAASEVIVGYSVYIDLIKDRFLEKEYLSTSMRQEVERCHLCFQKAREGKRVAMVCSGDAGVYGMASLLYEIGEEYEDCELVVVPGITAASSGAALLGAPLSHDFCVISLSDLLTPKEQIETRLRLAARGDFCMAIYNPSSHKRKDYLSWACEIIWDELKEERACGYVENIGREGERVVTCSLSELKNASVNMFTTVFIGNRTTKEVDGRLITKRGYLL